MYKHVNQNAAPAQAEREEQAPPLQLLRGWISAPRGSLGNAKRVLDCDQALASCVGGRLTVATLGHHQRDRYDVCLLSAPPWDEPEPAWGPCWCDKRLSGPAWPRPIADLRRLRLYLERAHQLIVSDRVLNDALALIGAEREPCEIALFHVDASRPKRRGIGVKP